MSVCLVLRPSLTQAVSLVKSAAKVIPPLGYSPLRGYSMLKGSPTTDPSDSTDNPVDTDGEQGTQPGVDNVGINDTFELVPRTHVFYERTRAAGAGQMKVREHMILKFISFYSPFLCLLDKRVRQMHASIQSVWPVASL